MKRIISMTLFFLIAASSFSVTAFAVNQGNSEVESFVDTEYELSLTDYESFTDVPYYQPATEYQNPTYAKSYPSLELENTTSPVSVITEYQNPTYPKSYPSLEPENTTPTVPAISDYSYVDRNSNSNKVYFDTNTTGWSADTIKQGIFMYLYDFKDGEIIVWGSKKGKMTDEGNGIYSFDFSEKSIDFQQGHEYGCIFAGGSFWGMQTCDLLIGTECFGHTAYCPGYKIENNVDSNKKSFYVLWDNGVDRTKYAPPLLITSIGNVVGEVVRPSKPKYDIFCEFLTDKLNYSREYSGKSDQQLIDDIAFQIGLNKKDVKNAIEQTFVNVEWSESRSTLAFGYPELISAKSVYGGVNLEWKPFENVYGYRVFYYGKNGWRGLGNTTSANYTDKDVRNGKSYLYTVRAIDENGGFISDYDHEGIEVIYMKSPEIKSSQSTADGVKLSWDKVDGVYAYRVFYYGKNGWRGLGNTTSNYFIDDDVSSGSTYTYTVRGLDSNGNFITGYNPAGFKATFIATPKVNKIENTANGVKLSWNGVKGAAQYRVFYKGRNGWTRLGTTSGTSFVDTDVRSGGTYTYTVRCMDKNGNYISGYNGAGWKYTFIAVPKISSLTSTSSGVKISWNKVTGASVYRVYYMGRNGWTRLGDTTGTTFIDDDVRSGGTYTYTIRCVTADGKAFTSYYDTSGKTITYKK